MGDTVWIFAENILLSLVGLAGYALWVARDFLFEFNWKKFWNGNKVFWLWAFLVQTLYSLVMAFYPELEKVVSIRLIASINALMSTNWDINEELTVTMVYLTGTWQLSRFAKKTATKNKLNNNTPEI